MKKRVLSVLLVLSMALSLAACGKEEENPTPSGANTPKVTQAPNTTSTPVPTASADSWAALTNGEIVNGKFVTKRKITVEVYDRGNDGGSDPTNNMYTEYIKKGMLEQHNIEVEYVAVPRWTETDQINNLLASSDAPDICYTYSYPTIQTYAGMGAVINLGDMVNDYQAILPNLWNWLGDYNINYDRDPKTDELWAIEGKRANTNRIVTFIRKDWLEKLNIAEPTTTEEFYKAICAFRDNAKTLLGADADKMVPFSVSYDVGWRAALLIESQLSPTISDKEYYVNGFDDRKFTENGTKEAIRTLNKWYNEGLLWKDFILYTTDSTLEDEMMKAGYTGAFMHNWDYPYRNGVDSIEANLKRTVGADASYVAIDCFTNSEGKTLKFGSDSASDRKIFFPTTNDEPLASLLYLDFISTPENIQYLQIGDKGVTHEVREDGAIAIIPATGDAIQNSGQNIDLTMTCNGLALVDPELTGKSLALNYAEVDPALVAKANKVATTNVYVPAHVNVGAIASEEDVVDALKSQRDVAFDNAVVASTSEFDKVWDKLYKEYLDMGGRDIINERTQKFEEFYGTATMIR